MNFLSFLQLSMEKDFFVNKKHSLLHYFNLRYLKFLLHERAKFYLGFMHSFITDLKVFKRD